MTDMTFTRNSYPVRMNGAHGRRRRTTGAALAAVVALAFAFGPGPALVTRLGAGEEVGFATVSAADTITRNDMLAEAAAAGRAR